MEITPFIGRDPSYEAYMASELDEAFIASAISEGRAREAEAKTFKDSLTGLYNRFGLAEMYKELSALRKRHNSNDSLMFIDLDGFKAVNDTYGHHIGDYLLKEVAKQMQE